MRDMSAPIVGPAARRAFYAAAALSVLCLIGAFFNPLIGLLSSIILAAVALGIRRRQVWAAVCGVFLLAVPVVVGLARISSELIAPMAITGAIQLTLAWLFLQAARELRRDP